MKNKSITIAVSANSVIIKLPANVQEEIEDVRSDRRSLDNCFDERENTWLMALIARVREETRNVCIVSFVSGGKKEIIRSNNAVNVGGVTWAAVVPGIPKCRGISESVAYARADIKTGHEAPWRRATLISRKHSAACTPTGLVGTRFITFCNEYSGAHAAFSK